MAVGNYETIDISTKIYLDINDGKDKEGVEDRFYLREFLHNPSILKVKIFGKEKTDFSITTNGFLWWTRLNDLEPNFSKFFLNL